MTDQLDATLPDLTMPELPRRGPWPVEREPELGVHQEWLVTNGLGGYASGPVKGGITRKYHGLLVAALPPPIGRLVCVSTLRTRVLLADRVVPLDDESVAPGDVGDGITRATFWLEGGLPVWRYEIGEVVLEKRVVMPHRRNTTSVIFSVSAESPPISLECYLLLDIRQHDSIPSDAKHTADVSGALLEIGARGNIPAVRISAHGGDVEYGLEHHEDTVFEMVEERKRGYPHLARVGTAGPVRIVPDRQGLAALTLSTETKQTGATHDPAALWNTERSRRMALVERAGHEGDAFVRQLVLAADEFVVVPVGHEDSQSTDAGTNAPGRTIIAGYHWFTDWGRDTMISLEGLTLLTGRAEEAGDILRLFGRHAHQGLIPNLFPEGQRNALYHTADATLWYFHAIDRYLAATGDRGLVDELLPLLRDILEHHRRGTLFGIGVDPEDGLLRQGAEGYQLTWMDAKVEEWVVTPRRGKAVEINALWHNALSLMADWLEATDGAEAAAVRDEARRMREAFNRRFWNPATGYLFDVVDGEGGDDPSCRPNQLFAISLRHPVLDSEQWASVLGVVRERLLTPVGLRTLSPEDPDYQARYFGDLRARDAAYHQGTVWPWLMGAYVDALLKVAPDDKAAARAALQGFDDHLDDACAGTLSEIFDASAPHVPRGCVAQAWSVAEVLRAWLKSAP